MDQTLLALFPTTHVVLDTRFLWATVEEAVQYVADRYLQQTTSLAMQARTRSPHGRFIPVRTASCCSRGTWRI